MCFPSGMKMGRTDTIWLFKLPLLFSCSNCKHSHLMHKNILLILPVTSPWLSLKKKKKNGLTDCTVRVHFHGDSSNALLIKATCLHRELQYDVLKWFRPKWQVSGITPEVLLLSHTVICMLAEPGSQQGEMGRLLNDWLTSWLGGVGFFFFFFCKCYCSFANSTIRDSIVTPTH